MTGRDRTDALRRIAEGDIQQFEGLYNQYYDRLSVFVVGLTHDEEAARDMVQEVFLKVWMNRKRLLEVESISSYLFVMARNAVYDYFDHLAVCRNYEEEYNFSPDASAEVSGEEKLFLEELQSLVERTLAAMPPQRQRVFRMSRQEGLSNDEIACRLGISKRTVENHLTAALAVLRKVVYLALVVGWR